MSPPATYSREDSTFGGLPTVGSVHISCYEEAEQLKAVVALVRTIRHASQNDVRREGVKLKKMIKKREG